jgi:hypothetical protein
MRVIHRQLDICLTLGAGPNKELAEGDRGHTMEGTLVCTPTSFAYRSLGRRTHHKTIDNLSGLESTVLRPERTVSLL